jgi:hypothetical protein
VLNSVTVKVLLSSLVVWLLTFGSSAGIAHSQSETPTLGGRWLLEFTLRSGPHRLQFDADPSGEGSFLSLDPASSLTPPLVPLKAAWSLKGQSSAIFFFSVVGEVAFPANDVGIEKGWIELAVTSDLTSPVSSIRGSGQFHSSGTPADTRGSEDPSFSFTGSRVSSLVVQLVWPNSGEMLKRGKRARIEWKILSALPLTSQKLFISLDGGESFAPLEPFLPADARSFDWTVPEDLKKTRRALIKAVAIDVTGASGEGVSEQMFRIK